MRLKHENKGFSLVELIITISVFAIVGVVLGAFMLSSSRAYSVNANELDIQEEAQLVANQLQEMILDTALGISYTYEATDEDGNRNTTFDIPADAADLDKTHLYIYGESYYYHIYWNVEEQKLYLVEYVYQVAEDGSSADFVPNDMTEAGVVLGEYISDFEVDLSKAASDRMVSFNILFKKPGSERDYLVAKSVSLRNNILLNYEGDIYETIGLEIEPKADNLTISPMSVTLWPGESRTYTVTKTCSRGGIPSQAVTWTLSSGEDGKTLSAGTRFVGNTLTIADDEECSLIYATATASGRDYSRSEAEGSIELKKVSTIYIPQVTGLSEVSNSIENNTVSRGGAYTIYVKAEGTYLSGSNFVLSEDNLSVTSTLGEEYVTTQVETSVEPLTGDRNQAKVTIYITDKALHGNSFNLNFNCKGKTLTLGTYTVSTGTEGLLKLESASGKEWLRLGSSTVKASFSDDTVAESYCDDSGNLKSKYYLKFVYNVYNSADQLVSTEYRTNSVAVTDSLTEYFAANSQSAGYTSVLDMTDKIFLTSGTVSVQAVLMSKTATNDVIAGYSNQVLYTIPAATLGFARNSSDTSRSNLVSYITKNQSSVPVYLTFTSGFASGKTPGLYSGLVALSPENIGIASVDSTLKKITVTGSNDANYKTNGGAMLKLKYGGLANGVTVKYVSANLEGTKYYIPLNKDEWTLKSSYLDDDDKRHSYYVYYMDDTHKLEISYVDDDFDKAEYYTMVNLTWNKSGNYVLDNENKSWKIDIS